jgi:PTH2 family peptidyl-tRNA hydrolase
LGTGIKTSDNTRMIMTAYKQAILLRKDLNMSKGKMVAQGSHASLGAYQKADSDAVAEWKQQGQKKIILEATESELQEKLEKAEQMNVTYFRVKDAGHTEVEPGTVTALGLGPVEEQRLDRITSDLPLLK